MERISRANGIEIWNEDFGDPSDPTILLIMGLSTQGIAWPLELCLGLADAGRHVVRYDARDTGRSTCFDFTSAPYSLTDMAADAVGLLDALGVDAAHLVGTSMGGMVAQEVAIGFPARVRTLTSIMSTPAVSTPEGVYSNGLAGPDARFLAVMAELVAAPPTTPEEERGAALRMFAALGGTLGPVDHDAVARVLDEQARRAPAVDTSTNHTLAQHRSRDRTALLGGVRAPTLVIHGTADPLIPYEHGVATATSIPGATLLPIEGMGHEFHPTAMSAIIEAIVAHTARS